MPKILRAVYTYDDADAGANVHLSRWIEDGLQATLEAELASSGSGREGEAAPTPVILGWEEQELGIVDLADKLEYYSSTLGDIIDKLNDIKEVVDAL